MNTRTQDKENLKDHLTVIFRHKRAISAIFLITVMVVTALSFLIAPAYEAKSSLLVKFGREYIYHSETADSQAERTPPLVSQEEMVNSEINILTSRDLIEKVIRAVKVENIYPLVENSSSLLADIGISPKLPPLQAAIIKFSKNLDVRAVKKSSVIEVSFQHKDPRIAAEAVNLLIAFYKVKHLEVYSGFQSPFLERQLSIYDRKLTESENELEEFKEKNRVYDLDEQKGLLLKQQMDLDTESKDTKKNIDELRSRLSTLQAQMKAFSLPGNKNAYTPTELDKIIVEGRGKLLDLQLEEQQLLEQYKETNPLVANVRKEIAIVSDFLGKQEGGIEKKVETGNPVYQGVEADALKTQAELSSQLANEGVLGRQLDQVNGEIGSLDLKGRQLEDLQRSEELDNLNYRNYAGKVEEARISDDMNRQKMANVSVIQEAGIPAKPVHPKKGLNILLSILLGAVAGVGYAFLAEYYSQVLSTPEGAEKRLGLPVLASIGYRR